MFKQMTVAQIEKLFSDDEFLILDVRDQDSYQESHIPGAIRFTIQELSAFCETADRALPILVYCYKGISSQSVAQHLIEEGFREVYNLTGGFEAWIAAHSTSD